MARKPTVSQEQQVDLEEAIQAQLMPANELQHLDDAQSEAAALQAAHKKDHEVLIAALVKSQVHRGYEKFSAFNRISEMKKVKEIKAYRSLKGQINPITAEILTGTWEEYCNILGMSVDKADIDIKNLNEFGMEALEVMDRAGLNYSQLKQLRKLPEDEKAALIEVAKSGDKEALVEFAETIFEKHSKEKAEVAKKLDDQQKDFQALEAVAKTHKEENNKLRMELEKSKLNTLPWSDVVAPLAEEIANHQAIIDKALDRHLQAISAIDVWHTSLVADAATDDPYAHVPLPQEAVTVLMSLEDAINRSAHAVAAIRDHLQNEFGAVLMNARRHLLIESEE